jgi:hypothetical protein
MKFRRSHNFMVFEKTKGWISTAQLEIGDTVSNHAFPPSYFKVVPPPEES